MAASMRSQFCCLKHLRKSHLFDFVMKNTMMNHSSRHMSSVKKSNSTEYCFNLVRKSDHENYLCTLLYPSDYRTSAFALRALNVELAQVQDVTTDKMRAIMRMQFWKDAINHIHKGSPPNTPVAIEVARAVEKHKLSKIWMMRILETRASRIETDTFRTVEEIENYAENTSAALSYLLLQCAGVQNVHADHAASHIGRCLGLVTVLRATPYHANRSKVYLPLELLLKHNVSEEDIKRGKTEQKVKDVVYDLACAAHQHLETARSFKKDVPKAALPVLNNSVICENYMKKLQLVDFNVFDPSLQVRNHLLPVQLLKQKLKRTY